MHSILIVFSFMVHEIYISTTEIVMSNRNAEVQIKIFRDDLEDDLRLFYGESISIDENIKLKKASKKIDTYIQNKFQLIIDRSKIDISKLKYDLQNDLVEISFFFNYNKKINELKVINNILFDVYKVQKNVVLINFQNQINSHIFSFFNREKIFTY